MIDIKQIREDVDKFNRNMAARGLAVNGQSLIDLDDRRKLIITETQVYEVEKNKLNKEVGLRRRNNQPIDDIIEKSKAFTDKIVMHNSELEEILKELKAKLEVLPNFLDEKVPEGTDEKDNLVIEVVNNNLVEFTFKPKNHYELTDGFDFDRATKIAGSRNIILRKDVAKLHRALAQFMLDELTENKGFEETIVPVMVNTDAMYNADKLPKFSDQSFQTTDNKWLIPTSEVPLVSQFAGEIVNNLPKLMTCHSLCFRSEAGAAGKDTKGLIRQHQFEKVELVTICEPNDSEIEFKHLQKSVEHILGLLGLPYRKVLLCAGDTGFGASITYDYEVWMPGQNQYREISSCSNTKDFQAHRANIRSKIDGKNVFVHTMNGSCLAVGRTLAAILENYQTEDGHINIPECLTKYMNKEVI